MLEIKGYIHCARAVWCPGMPVFLSKCLYGFIQAELNHIDGMKNLKKTSKGLTNP